MARVVAAFVLSGLAWALLTAAGSQLAQAQVQAQAQTPNDYLIVPRHRIGAVPLGASAAELTAALGEPQSIWPGDVHIYNWDGLSATVTKNGAYTTQICTTSPSYGTAQGLHPGSTDQAVTDLMGPPRYARVFTAWWRMSYTDLYWPGLTVSVHLKGFESNNRVWKICVNQSAAIPE